MSFAVRSQFGAGSLRPGKSTLPHAAVDKNVRSSPSPFSGGDEAGKVAPNLGRVPMKNGHVIAGLIAGSFGLAASAIAIATAAPAPAAPAPAAAAPAGGGL